MAIAGHGRLDEVAGETTMKPWQEDGVQSLLTCESETELFQRLVDTAHGLGFDYVAYGIRLPLPVAMPKTFMLNNYPAAWQRRYQEKNYLVADPTVRLGMRTALPFLWSEDLFAPSRELWEDARSFGLCVGWVQSCRDPSGVSGMLTLARSYENLSEIELRDKTPGMSWLAQITHVGMARLLVPKLAPENKVSLSQREIQVLRWTAEGKTSNQVADILKISERTVNFHITNAVNKLGADNKTAAAIRAALLGMLY